VNNSDSNSDPIILIVEDSRAIVSELQRKLDGLVGFRTEVVSTLADAREFLNWHSKDIFLAILDLNLPDSSGGEIVDLFCSMAVPSIVFTADFNETTRKRMLSKEIIDYVVKDTNAVGNITDYIVRLLRNRETKVLVVEDSKSFRFSLCSMLEKQMFQVVDVGNAEAALEVMEREASIRLVIVDYGLPGMNGVDLTRKLRAKYSKDTLSIIGLSISDDPLLTVRFIKSGANDYIAKPFEVEEFYSRVGHCVETLDRIRQLQDANQVKNRFLGMAAHDLRGPINGINGFTEMLLGDLCGEMNKEQREAVEYISSANLHMNDLVSDLLDISVFEAGKLQLIKSESDLRDIIEIRLGIHAIEAKKKSITFESDLEDVGSFVFDSKRMRQVLDNLLSNALKFSPHGGVVEISLEKKGAEIEVCVRDQGEGVPEGEERLLFKSFEKTSVRPTAGESSTGLGLPIVKNVVEAHGGQVWVESEYRKGAMFCFTLPLESSS